MVLSLILFRAQLNLFPDHVTFPFSDSISHLSSGTIHPFAQFPSVWPIYPTVSLSHIVFLTIISDVVYGDFF